MLTSQQRRLAALESARKRVNRSPPSAGDLALWAALYGLSLKYGHLVNADRLNEDASGPDELYINAIRRITLDMTPQEAVAIYAQQIAAASTIAEYGGQDSSINVVEIVDFIEAIGRIDPEVEAEFWSQSAVWENVGSNDARSLNEIHRSACVRCPFPPPRWPCSPRLPTDPAGAR